MISTFLIASGIVLSAVSLVTCNSNSNNNSNETKTTTKKTRKQIKDFSYHEIKSVLEYELYGKSTSDLNEILRYNNYYTDNNLNHYEIAEKIASSAQYGNRIYPTYLEEKIEDRLNEKYN